MELNICSIHLVVIPLFDTEEVYLALMLHLSVILKVTVARKRATKGLQTAYEKESDESVFCCTAFLSAVEG